MTEENEAIEKGTLLRKIGSWHQILSVFASRGNVKAALLSKIILVATLLAENAVLRVDYVTCDDFPHLVKCIRNGFIKTGYKTPQPMN
ncbi:hypothetical protein HPB50_029197 [Hyalomma asiaticum]|nr:hypothetical protein HPB50_029197 [Hyalomma asiaticum]